MSLTREERKLLHQKSQQPTFGSGKPTDDVGFNGDISYRKVEGSGTVQYLKENNSWTAISSSGDMPPIRIAGGGGGGGSSSSGVTSHNDLTSLSSDDHVQYLLIDGTRAMTGNTSFGSDGAGVDVTFHSATSGDKMLWDASEEQLVITGTNGQTSLNVADGNVTIADTLTATNIGAYTLTGKLTAGSVEIEGTAFDINGGAIDGTAIGAASHSTIKGTTIDATTDFTIDGLVLTADTITNDAALTVDVAGDIILDANSGVTKFYLAGDTNDYASLTVAANGVTTLATFDDGGTVGHLTLDADGDIILDAAGDDIYFKDAGSERFRMDLDDTPTLAATGALTIHGSSTMTLDATSDFIAKTNTREVIKANTSSNIYFHAYAQTLFNDYYININASNRHLTSGVSDFQQNYSWLGKHSVSSGGAYNADFGT